MTEQVVESLGNAGLSDQVIIGILIALVVIIVWVVKNIDDIIESLNKLFTWKQRREELKATILKNEAEIKELKEHDISQERVMLEFKSEMCESIQKIFDKLDAIEEKHKNDNAKNEERTAIEDRSAIIAFVDEEHNGHAHSREGFRDAMRRIENYKRYCDTHQNFKNGEAILSIEFIESEYKKRFIE